MLLRMMTPTRAKLICREITATLSAGTCTKGRKENRYAITKLTTSAFVEVDSPGLDEGERGIIRLKIDCHDHEC